MDNDIDKKKTTDLTTDQSDLFERYGSAATARNIEGDLLKFVQGDFLAGQDGREIPLGTRLSGRMNTLCVGYQRWENGQPTEQRHMGLVAEGYVPPKRSELGDLDKGQWERDAKGAPKDPWSFSNLLVFDNPKTSEVFTYATSSRGGISAVGELCKLYGKHIRQHPDEDPLIELDASSYLHPEKTIGRVKVPVFKLVGWIDKNGPNSANDAAPAPSEPPKSPPSDKGGAAAKPAQPVAKSTIIRKPAAQPQF
jgi:hypothetical protein